MNSNKYVDTSAIVQVISAVYQNPNLLDNEQYHFLEEDFTEDFHKIIFGSILNLHNLGAKEITINTIEDYLRERTSAFSTYIVNKGAEYLNKLVEIGQPLAFDYYYHRMKKFTLLRSYTKYALMDLSWLYDPDNILDIKKKQRQEDWLDKASEQEIVDIINQKIDKIKNKYLDNSNNNFIQAGEGLRQLVQHLQQYPEVGYPLYGDFINTIYRGARLKKFYLRSAATGVGKSRSMVADMCVIGCSEYFNKKTGQWQSCGNPESVSFIGTEQEIDEIQTMMLAFVANVNEAHILYNEYAEGEYERVQKAIEIIEKSGVHFKVMMDFSMVDIENAIKFSVREFQSRYVFFDYIHSSMKILGEISSKAGVKGLREDNVLFMISVKLKDLCNQYGIFLMSATQLSNDYHTATIYDQGLLQGAKAIANKVDAAEIDLEVTSDDLDALKDLIEQNGFETPKIKKAVYKNRRGQYKNILIWCTEDRGTCRIDPIFITDYQYKLIDVPNLIINIDTDNLEQESAF